MKTDSRTLALIGAALLFVGAFLPLVSVPIMGSINYVNNGGGDGIFIVGLAAISAVLALLGRTRFVLFTGLASLALLAFTYLNLQSNMSGARAKMGDNPFADAAMAAIQMQWGWAVLLLGALIVIYAGWQSWRVRT